MMAKDVQSGNELELLAMSDHKECWKNFRVSMKVQNKKHCF